MKFICALAALTALAWAGDQAGLKPKFEASDYPAHAAAGSTAIGARLLTPAQVRGSFSTELDPAYVVVEVAIYPKDGSQLDLGPGDFTLRIAGTDASVRPAAPRTIATILQKGAAKDRDIAVYPGVGVGYGTGPGYDPVYGGRRGGWSTATGVGVGVGGPRPAATDADRKTMELELGDQQLPEKIITAPVAGYLYFPAGNRKKDTAYVLEYQGGGAKADLALAPR